MIPRVQNFIERVDDPIVYPEVCSCDDGFVNFDSTIPAPEKTPDLDIYTIVGKKSIEGSRLKIPERDSLWNDVVCEDVRERIPVREESCKVVLWDHGEGLIGGSEEGDVLG